ncbi:MAG: hypothetical protein ABFD65_14015 [Candidatus Polarisedimenticolia bacterium]
MPSYTSRETQVLRDQPANIPGDPAYGGRERRFRATIDLNNLRLNSSAGSAVAGLVVNDDVLLCDLPPGYRFAGYEIVSTVGLGTTTINIGNSQTHASNTKFATGITVPTANVPVVGGGAGLGLQRAAAPSPGERIFATFGTAAVAASANSITIDIIALGP